MLERGRCVGRPLLQRNVPDPLQLICFYQRALWCCEYGGEFLDRLDDIDLGAQRCKQIEGDAPNPGAGLQRMLEHE